MMHHWNKLANGAVYKSQLWFPSGHLRWSALWRITHTDKLWYNPKNQSGHVRWSALFFIFHCMGSIVSSSCLCESAGSLLKRFSTANVATKQILDRTVLKFAGLSGEGHDDSFILRCWLETVASPGDLEFFYRDHKRRSQQFPLGNGSKTLHKLRKLRLAQTRWTAARLRRVPRVAKRRLKGGAPPSLARWRHSGVQKNANSGLWIDRESGVSPVLEIPILVVYFDLKEWHIAYPGLTPPLHHFHLHDFRKNKHDYVIDQYLEVCPGLST